MSDIPIGSPPVPPGRHAAPQGWYPDPVDLRRERYWDGWSWSRNTRESTQPLPPQPHGQFQQVFQPHQVGPAGSRPPFQPYPQGRQPQAFQHPAAALTADGVPIAGWGWRFLAGILDLIVVNIVSDIASIPILLKLLPAFREYFREVVQAARQGGQAPPALSPTELVSTLSGSDQILITVILLVVGLLYFGLSWRLMAATPAQLLCGLRVVPADRADEGRNAGHHDSAHDRSHDSPHDSPRGNNNRLSWQIVAVRAVVWWVPFAVSSVLLIFAAVNAIFPLTNVKRQAVHDLAARTQVVKIR